MSVCRQCPKCRGWGKLRSRTGVIIDCGSCLGSGCAKHKATPGLPVGANCMKLRARDLFNVLRTEYPREPNGATK